MLALITFGPLGSNFPRLDMLYAYMLDSIHGYHREFFDNTNRKTTYSYNKTPVLTTRRPSLTPGSNCLSSLSRAFPISPLRPGPCPDSSPGSRTPHAPKAP